MKLNEYIDYKETKGATKKDLKDTKISNDDQKKIAEMKFEYESLQRSWKMHRDRLQEYVMAYRDAVAKLKHSYHQRDSLCKKIETIQQEKKKLNESIQLQNKNYHQTMEEAQKLTQKFQRLSQQMQPPQIMQQQSMPIMNNMNNYNLGQYQQYQQYPPMQQPIYSANNYQPGAQTQNDEIKKQQYSSYLQNLIQQKNEIMKNDPTNPALQVV